MDVPVAAVPVAEVHATNRNRATSSDHDNNMAATAAPPPPSYEQAVVLSVDSSAVGDHSAPAGNFKHEHDNNSNNKSLAVSCHNFVYRTLSEVEVRLNMNNAKMVALGLVLFLVAVRGTLYLYTGLPVSCVCQVDPNPDLRHAHCPLSALLGRGEGGGGKSWRPEGGCSVHDYSKRSLDLCFLNRGLTYVKIVGDSRMRTLYQRYVSQFGCQLDVSECEHDSRSCIYVNPALGLMIDYANRNCTTLAELQALVKSGEERTASLPDVLVVGVAAWSILEHNASTGVEHYTHFLQQLTSPMKKLAVKGVKILWALQEPVLESRLSPDLAALTNQRLDQYNDLAEHTLYGDYVHMWHAFRQMAVAPATSGEDDEEVAPPWYDGFNYDPESTVRQRDAALLNNVLCNGLTNDTVCSCCSTTYPFLAPFTPLQLITFSLIASLLLASLAALTLLPPHMHDPPALLALAKIALVVLLVAFCDRTQFFEKTAKQYSATAFWLPLTLLLLFGSVFTERAETARHMREAVVKEWRGWMQIVLLVINLTNADKLLPLHMLSRVMTSSYLFLAGHDLYHHLWRGGQPSWRHFLRHLWDLNLSAVLLCFALGQQYQFYSLVALVTFWYAALYALLAVRPIMTQATPLDASLMTQLVLFVKFLVAVLVVMYLYLDTWFFHKFFDFPLWRGLFVTSHGGGGVSVWHETWTVDRHSALGGVLVTAFAAMLHRRYVNTAAGAAWALRGVALVGGLAGGIAYILFALSCETRAECDAWHAYLAAVPVLSYAALRWTVSDTAFSTCYAWLGDRWPELTVLQHHLFLAADGRGVLAVLPGCTITNLLVTAFVLVCAADEMRMATLVLKKYAVPEDWRRTLANGIVLSLVLVPVNVMSLY